jgi:hypothetical protein
VAIRGFLAVAAVVFGLATASVGVAQAEPTNPPPGPTTTSTDDELVDMVMDALSHGETAPTTLPDVTPVVPPPH